MRYAEVASSSLAWSSLFWLASILRLSFGKILQTAELSALSLGAWRIRFFSHLRIAIGTLFYSKGYVIYLFSSCCGIYSFIKVKRFNISFYLTPDRRCDAFAFCTVLIAWTFCCWLWTWRMMHQPVVRYCVRSNCQLQSASHHTPRRRSTYTNEWLRGPLALCHVDRWLPDAIIL